MGLLLKSTASILILGALLFTLTGNHFNSDETFSGIDSSIDSTELANSDQLAEIKFSINTLALNRVLAFVGDLIDNLTTGFPLNIPVNLDIHGKWNLYRIAFNNFKLANHTIAWNKGAVTINSGLLPNTMNIKLTNVSLNFTAFEEISVLKYLAIKNDMVLTINNMNLTAAVAFLPNKNDTSLGFTLQFTTTTLAYSDFEFNLLNQHWLNTLIQPYVATIAKALPTAVLGLPLVLNKIFTPLCANMLKKDIVVGDYTYEIMTKFVGGVTVKNSDVRIPIDIVSITNLNTTSVAPVHQTVPLPDFYYNNHTNRYDFEVILGTGISNQVLWILADSNIASKSLNATSPIFNKIPLSLTLNGIKQILPALYTDYVVVRRMDPSTGLYLQTRLPNQIPNVRLVGGRLIGSLIMDFTLLVSLNEDEYPCASLSNCKTETALQIEAIGYFAVDVYTPGQFKFGLNMSNLEIVSASKISGKSEFNGPIFATAVTQILSVYVSSINSQLSQGVDIPLVNQASFLNDMTLIFEQGYIIGDVSVNPNS